jgi:hypothetical protein
MGEDYADGRVQCDADRIRLRGYYVPWGTKRIAYGSIADLLKVDLGAFRGRARIWGTANPRYWANFDPTRMRKKVGFIVDLGRFVKPFVTPDDPDAFEAVVRARADLGSVGDGTARGPII